MKFEVIKVKIAVGYFMNYTPFLKHLQHQEKSEVDDNHFGTLFFIFLQSIFFLENLCPLSFPFPQAFKQYIICKCICHFLNM